MKVNRAGKVRSCFLHDCLKYKAWFQGSLCELIKSRKLKHKKVVFCSFWKGDMVKLKGSVIVPSLATRNNTPKVKELVSQTLWLNQLVAESVVEFMNFGGMYIILWISCCCFTTNIISCECHESWYKFLDPVSCDPLFDDSPENFTPHDPTVAVECPLQGLLGDWRLVHCLLGGRSSWGTGRLSWHHGFIARSYRF